MHTSNRLCQTRVEALSFMFVPVIFPGVCWRLIGSCPFIHTSCGSSRSVCYHSPSRNHVAFINASLGCRAPCLGKVYGPATSCLWGHDWDELDQDERDRRIPWQGEPHGRHDAKGSTAIRLIHRDAHRTWRYLPASAGGEGVRPRVPRIPKALEAGNDGADHDRASCAIEELVEHLKESRVAVSHHSPPSLSVG